MSHQTDHIKAIRDARAAAVKLTDTEKSLRAQHAALVKERTSVVETIRSLDEVLANMERLVDQAASKWGSDFGRTVAIEASGYTEIRSGGLPDLEVRPRLPPFPGGGNRLNFEWVCALAPSIMKTRLAEIIRQSGANFGLPAEARVAKLAEMEAQIAEVEAQHTSLVDAAGEVGITLPLLNTVRERREAEALRLERERELAAQRAAGIYPVTMG